MEGQETCHACSALDAKDVSAKGHIGHTRDGPHLETTEYI